MVTQTNLFNSVFKFEYVEAFDKAEFHLIFRKKTNSCCCFVHHLTPVYTHLSQCALNPSQVVIVI